MGLYEVNAPYSFFVNPLKSKAFGATKLLFRLFAPKVKSKGI